LQGQSDSGDIVLSGGTETVAPLGVSREPILDGGSLFDGGFVTHAQVSAGGTLFDTGAANHTTLSSGGVIFPAAIGADSRAPDYLQTAMRPHWPGMGLLLANGEHGAACRSRHFGSRFDCRSRRATNAEHLRDGL
jgi:hypothetical protein